MEDQLKKPDREQQRLTFKRAVERANRRAAERRAAAETASDTAPETADEQRPPIHPARFAGRNRPLPPMLDPLADVGPEVRRPPLVLALPAGLAWSGAVLLLASNQLGPDATLQTRILYCLLLLIAGLLSFVPLQWGLRLPSLTWRGTFGWGLTFYILAFVPAPSDWLLYLPDLPVYLMLMMAVFLAANATALPIIYSLGLRTIVRRTDRFNLRRVHRQAAEVGLLGAGAVGLAGLGMLTPISLLLLTVILGMAEILILGGHSE